MSVDEPGPIGTRRKTRTRTISVMLPVDVIERLDAWRREQFIHPSRNAAVRRIIIDFLDRQKDT